MSRWSQNLTLILLGGAVVWISAFTTSYLNYVKAGFQPFLIAAGVIVAALGVLGLVRRPAAHEHAPRVAWLMTLPVFAIVLIAPPALGSFAASRSQRPPEPPANAEYDPISAAGGPADMKIAEFLARAFGDKKKSLTGKSVRLTGFVTPSKKKGQWYVTRMSIACCAADGYALQVAVLGAPAPKADSWVEVTGTWVPPKWKKLPSGMVFAEIAAAHVQPIKPPSEPYE
ncbi:TIGR03943 family putative permease subunit [Sinosporangium siamense]|uniref:Membrane protein n=1 Tax=Sinosporangium siamense TaxID=1367973 RepID=A0A919VAV5_9ACTN|nr:TIGR03943 family protein [Sinosporangium siamense]GII95807.1 membrane protein [Sinosporangium siamense]